jgi:hypothetical protein
MIRDPITRRRFIESSIASGLVMGFAKSKAPIAFAASERAGADGLTLKITGNATKGYGVDILFAGVPIAHHNRGGEFSAIFQNAERSLTGAVDNWRATSWTGDSAHLALTGTAALSNLGTTVYVRVEYTVVTPGLVRKSIQLRQADMFMLFYQVSNRLEPKDVVAKFWSFDQLNCKGGPLHEYFPAAGFRTKDGLTVGLLTDSGYRNQWSRLIRRDGRPVKPAPRVIPDVNLYSVFCPDGSSDNPCFVQQTFGEAQVQDSGLGTKIILPAVSSWHKLGGIQLQERDGITTLNGHAPDNSVAIPFHAAGGEVYSVNVEYRSRSDISVEIWDVDEELHKLADATLFNDDLPASPATWSRFETTVMLPGLRGNGGALVIAVPQSEGSGNPAVEIEIRSIELRRLLTRSQPYHRLEMGGTATKTSFIFADANTPDSLRDYRLASQLQLANSLGFAGGVTEKVLYSDLMMLSWIIGPEDFRPICAPSIWYSAAGEMYLRDSFFALNGIHNRELNEAVFNLWADNQGEDGAINTLVEPNLANLERKSNDSTPLWLMWALLNRRRFGTALPMDKLRMASEYCLRTFDPDRSGVCRAQFVMGQLDVIRYPEGTSTICENQGLLAITLRVIKELQIPEVSATISDEHIAKAEEGYRSYYDTVLKFFRPARDIADAIGFAEIFPEYLSLWLFNRKVLTDEMVINHLDHIPTMMPRRESPYPETGGTVRPIFIGLPEGGKNGWRYFTEHWHPMVSDSFASNYANHTMDGVYYNGGSWMRLEMCGYVTGKLHGWSTWDKAVANRLWAELNSADDFPTSQEYLATEQKNPFYGFHRVFAWNAFVLQALEFAGLRKPEMDPDFAS